MNLSLQDAYDLVRSHAFNVIQFPPREDDYADVCAVCALGAPALYIIWDVHGPYATLTGQWAHHTTQRTGELCVHLKCWKTYCATRLAHEHCIG